MDVSIWIWFKIKHRSSCISNENMLELDLFEILACKYHKIIRTLSSNVKSSNSIPIPIPNTKRSIYEKINIYMVTFTFIRRVTRLSEKFPLDWIVLYLYVDWYIRLSNRAKKLFCLLNFVSVFSSSSRALVFKSTYVLNSILVEPR